MPEATTQQTPFRKHGRQIRQDTPEFSEANILLLLLI